MMNMARQRPVRLLCNGVALARFGRLPTAGAARAGVRRRSLGGGPAHSRVDNFKRVGGAVGEGKMVDDKKSTDPGLSRVRTH
jgi:hypothetical protein